MPDMDETGSQEPVFRANKRRKVFRKRNAVEDEQIPAMATTAGETGQEVDDVRSVVRRPATKKQGVTFSASASQMMPPASDSEMALVPAPSGTIQVDEATQHDRFTKPTGKAEVVEDKHLTAYVDSKLAELRSSSATPAQSTPETVTTSPPSTFHAAPGQIREERGIPGAGAPPDSSKQQKTGYAYGSRNRPPKPRRQAQTRDEDSLARDAMIDRILQESEVPLYDRSSSSVQPSSTPGLDADEAAAQAFKADFLAGLARQNRRKPPAPPANSRTAQPTSTGPKLGGSRSQREKMRAMGEAKNAAKK